ncbi:MAG TPA: MBL fold metallo-hydrolase [Ktedonobacterales bacterium]|nr:MBL fold metallo-hydrolase [Ktedonobacterales bacterium]
MYFRQLRLPDMGCASYIVGGDGACAVVDPRWDAVAQYLGLARQQGLTITAILETHTHADHVSGATRLAARTGAPIYIHDAATVSYPRRTLHDGDLLTVGSVRIEVLHTPGHSMDSTCLLVHDASGAEPSRLLSGDTLFVNDVGRPDLHAASGDQASTLAEALYTSLHHRLLKLDDATEVFPAHLAGSLCGKRIAPDPSTTIGRQRQSNPSLGVTDRETFVRAMLDDLPPRPPNVSRIVQLNREGAATGRPEVRQLSPAEVRALWPRVIPVDGRDCAVFAQAHLAGALNAPISYGQLGVMLAWTLSPEAPLLLIAGDEEDLKEAVDSLQVVGMTNPFYALEANLDAWREAGLPVEVTETIEPGELYARLTAGGLGNVVDVREPGELGGGVIEGTVNIPYRLLTLAEQRDALAQPVVTVCNSGNRSSFAASLLARVGVRVINLGGGTTAWEEAELPLSKVAVPAGA